MRLLSKVKEIHELTFCPHSLRCMLTDVLAEFSRRSKIYYPANLLIERAMKKGAFTKLRDFCSGGGLFLASLEDYLRETMIDDTKISVCDKFPNIEAFEKLSKLSGGRISYDHDPVDINAPSDKGPEFRTAFSATHHFEPEEIEKTIRRAVGDKCGIGFFDYVVFDWIQTPMRLVLTFPMVWFITLFIRPLTWRRLLFTYVIPAVPMLTFIDALISHMKGYSVKDLSKIAASLSDLQDCTIEYGQLPSCYFTAKISYLIVYPKAKQGAAPHGKSQRVVITGYGVVSPLGNSAKETYEAIKQNQSGVKYLEEFRRYNGLSCMIGAPAKPLNEKLIPRQHRRSMGPLAVYAAFAADEAVKRSGLSPELLGDPRTGCIIGSTTGSATVMEESFRTILSKCDMKELSSTQFFKCVSHTASMNTAMHLGINGCQLSPAGACASGLQAAGLAYQLIRSGVMDRAICGGADELNILVSATFDGLLAASSGYNDAPEKSPRPFDEKRDGVVCGEGAGILIIESLESALKRNAPIYAEIKGYASCSSGENMSSSDSSGIESCMRTALSDANMKPEDIDLVSAHATGTVQGDGAEAKAIRAIFGGLETPVSALKGYMGHTLGASGALETCLTLMMMRDGLLLPVRNLEKPSEDCAELNYICEKQDKKIKCFMKNCFAFGGLNSVLICAEYKE